MRMLVEIKKKSRYILFCFTLLLCIMENLRKDIYPLAEGSLHFK